MKKYAIILFGLLFVSMSPLQGIDSGDPNILIPYLEAPAGSVAFTPEQIDAQRVLHRQVERPLFESDGRSYTDHKRPAAEVSEAFLPLKKGAAPIAIKLKDLKTGLYSLFVYGTIARDGREKLPQVWKPCTMGFNLKDSSGKTVGTGLLCLKQSFFPRRMQGFHFQIDKAGDYTASFWLGASSQEVAEIISINLIDRLAGLPEVAVKTAQHLEAGSANQLKEISPERQAREEMVWKSLPPLNIHWVVQGQVPQFTKPPTALKLPKWRAQGLGEQTRWTTEMVFETMDFVNPETGEVFPYEKILNCEAWPGERPDDGTGIYLTKAEFPELETDIYYCPRAEMIKDRFWVFFQALIGFQAKWKDSLPYLYQANGDEKSGHDAALMLVRLAYDWPAVEMSLHDFRLCVQNPDLEFKIDATMFRRNGKYFQDTWSGEQFCNMLKAYDALFPYIKGNQVFATQVSRFIPWIKTPEDVLRFLDRRLILAGIRDFNQGLIKGAQVEETIVKVLGPGSATTEFLKIGKKP